MSEKRKLMLISPMLHQGGFERVCITTARLMEPYFDVTIVVFNSANIAYNVDGLKIIDLQLGAKPGKLRKLLNIIRRSRKLRKLKKELRPDIAYSFGPTANMANAFSKTGTEKVWLGLRNYTDIEETVKIRLFVRLADLILCCSKEIEKKLREEFHFTKTATLYNLYDVEAIRRVAAQQEPDLPWAKEEAAGERLRYLVSMGRDDDMKGFWHMIKVFALVHEQIPQARLILMGAGSFEHYKKLAQELHVADAICFAGMQKEPYHYLKKGEVYLLTSQNEGFPNALVEGMSLGLAPVSVNCMTGPAEILLEDGDASQFAEQRRKGEMPVIYGEYGILVPVMEFKRDLDPGHITQEEKNMAEIVTALLLDEEKLRHYRQAAVERAQIFTYENYVERFLDLDRTKSKIMFHLNCLEQGGAERVVSNLANQFAKENYEVIVATEWQGENEFALDERVRRVHVGLRERDEGKGRAAKVFLRARYLRRLIREENPDIVIAFAHKANYRALMSTIGMKTPVMISVRTDPVGHYDGLSDKIQIPLLFPRAAGCVFQTEGQRAFFPAYVQKKSRIILNPVHEKYFHAPEQLMRRKTVVQSGRLVDFKNQPMLVEAFVAVHEKHPDYDLEIYGPDSLDGTKELLEKCIADHHAEDYIRLMGASDSLEQQLVDAAVYAFSSDWEGLPNALLEAMALGLPIVATDCPCGGPRTVITDGENGLLVPIKDAAAMEAGINRLIEDRELAERLGRNARKIREKTNGEAIIAQWRDYINEIIDF